MQELDLHDMWFQLDGATCHTERVTIDLLSGEFGEHFFSPSRAVNWPPRSCDLTPLEYVEAHVYVDHLKATALQHLHEIILKH